MRKSFQLWLFVFIFASFVVTFLLSFYVQTYRSRHNAIQTMYVRIGDTRKEIVTNDENRTAIQGMFNRQAIAKAKSLAQMVMLNPALVDNRDSLAQIAKNLDVDELHISDNKGILIASLPYGDVGYDMNSAEQSREFMDALKNPLFELVQEPRPNGRTGKMVQYAGVARQDMPGIVQIGYSPERMRQANMIADLEKLSPGFRIGNTGKIIICRNNTIIGIDNKAWLNHSIDDYGIDQAQLDGNMGVFSIKLKEAGTLCVFERYRDYLILALMPNEEVFLARDSTLFELTIFNIILFLVVFVVVTLLVDRVVISGIYKVNDSLQKITSGDLTERVSVHTNSEFKLLSNGINQTVDALHQAIDREVARLDRELALARSIQTSVLPRIFPPFPERNEFSLYASMDTAKEVGGDFYDFGFVDDNHIAIIIADVSGKGIPAALFMMTAMTVIKNCVESGLEPQEVFKRANHHLFLNNDAGMFVTAFLGIIELDTGKFVTCSAGHNPPLLKQGTQSFEYYKSQGGFVLAGMDEIEYKQSETTLLPGDRIFLYTDGVTEAFNTREELFGESRLRNTLKQEEVQNLSPEEVLPHVRHAMDQFIEGAIQSDDITMLMFDYYGPQSKEI